MSFVICFALAPYSPCQASAFICHCKVCYEVQAIRTQILIFSHSPLRIVTHSFVGLSILHFRHICYQLRMIFFLKRMKIDLHLLDLSLIIFIIVCLIQHHLGRVWSSWSQVTCWWQCYLKRVCPQVLFFYYNWWQIYLRLDCLQQFSRYCIIRYTLVVVIVDHLDLLYLYTSHGLFNAFLIVAYNR